MKISSRLFLLVIIGLLSFSTSMLYANADRQAAKPFSLSNLDGDSVALEDFRGQVVFVNFWATWCPPCVHELPSIQGLKEHFQDQSFEVVALNMGERPRTIQSFLDSFGTKLDFHILLNADHNVAKSWQVRGMPTTVIIDKRGDIAESWIGPKDWNTDEVKQHISLLLAE